MARTRCLLVLVALLAIGVTRPDGAGSPQRQQPHPSFPAQIAALSEPGGYFDTDNLISNETSYQQVLPELRRGNVRGGAYIGVGPDQNFTYVAEVRPVIAFIVDVRRDNLLLHLIFKALFQLARTRLEYLALLTGRAVPADLAGWHDAPIARIVAHIDRSRADSSGVAAVRGRVDDVIKRTGVPLSPDDLGTIDRFHHRFIEAGLDLRFQTTGRPPQDYYPTYRQLLIETDPLGHQSNYLASEDAFQFVKGLQARDLVIPVVGDLSGPSALRAIGRLLTERGERLSAFYASNVEFYLVRDGRYPSFVANLGRIPHAENSVVIRSVFGRYGPSWARPGDVSTSSVQLVKDVLTGSAGR